MARIAENNPKEAALDILQNTKASKWPLAYIKSVFKKIKKYTVHIHKNPVYNDFLN